MLEHGGKLREAALNFKRPLADWLDLSTGINPHAYPVPTLRSDIWHRLPEDDPALLAAAQSYYAAPQLLPIAGSQAAIAALPRLRRALHGPARVLAAATSYAEHAHHWSQHGHTLRQLNDADLAEAMSAAELPCDVLVICNPNNPTGTRIAPVQLLAWADLLAAHDGWLVVDEAFGDMQPEDSVASYSQRPGLIVLRSLGKFFGLAGVRLGFVAAASAILRALADQLGPWAVSSAAQEIACVALRDQAWQTTMRIDLAHATHRLQTLLGRYGIASTGTDLFQWWRQAQAVQLHHHMAQRGIWVRLFTHDGGALRLGLPPDEAGWQRLDLALGEWTDAA
ncbi:MAG: threonine-phosphate decarboxylase CobD [Pseudomonadota bacterium]